MIFNFAEIQIDDNNEPLLDFFDDIDLPPLKNIKQSSMLLSTEYENNQTANVLVTPRIKNDYATIEIAESFFNEINPTP